MNELIKNISRVKDDIVFVGGVTLSFHGKKDGFSDIDVVVTDVTGLEFFGEIILFDTKSIFSLKGKRAYIKREDYMIDIFIENSLPDFIIHDGIKYATMEQISSYYDEVLELARCMEPSDLREKYIRNIENKMSYL
jgi:hypothetical protein